MAHVKDIAALWDAGYRRIPVTGEVHLDEATAGMCRCGNCGNVGLALFPMSHPSGSYRAVTRCPTCGAVDEL